MTDLSRISTPASEAYARLMQSWGAPLPVTSGYRSPEYNAKVGGAKNSQHLHGNAYDVSTSGLTQAQQIDLINKARASGFGGVGVYDNSLHFDVGAPRAWGSDYTSKTLPSWAASALGSAPAAPQMQNGGQQMADQPMGLLAQLGLQKRDPNATGETALPFMQRDSFKNTMGNLAIGLNSMRLNPDPNVATIVGNQMQSRKDQQMANKTIEWLARQPNGQKYAELAASAGPAVALKAYQDAISGASVPAGLQSLKGQALAAGLVEGTKEYQQFMLYGGAKQDATPAAFEALHRQAIAAGYAEGSPEYQRFMQTRGAGEVATARALGAAQGTASSEIAGGKIAMDQALTLVDALKNDPALPDMVGPIDAYKPNISAASNRFQSRLDQLKGTAFLQAYQMLKGGGAITENEGIKAEQAMSRLNTAMNEQDFITALNEFQDAVRSGYEKIKARAGMGSQPAAPAPVPQPAQSNDDPLGLRG